MSIAKRFRAAGISRLLPTAGWRSAAEWGEQSTSAPADGATAAIPDEIAPRRQGSLFGGADGAPARPATRPRGRLRPDRPAAPEAGPAVSQCPPSVAGRVAAGAARFDRLRPGWTALIDAGRLDVQEGGGCPLAQVWGSVAAGLRAVFAGELREVATRRVTADGRVEVAAGWRGVGTGDLAALGLASAPAAGNEYLEINEAWRAEVARRRG